MSTLQTSFHDVEIKDENALENKDVDSSSVPDATQINFAIPKPKCGEILVACTGHFTFVCTLCLKEFVELQCFGKHIQTQHMSTVKNEGKDKELREEQPADPLASAELNVDLMSENDDHQIMHTTSDDPETDDEDYEPPATEDLHSPSLDDIDSSKRSNLYVCDLCGRSYLHKRSYEIHKKKVHDKETSHPKSMRILTDLPVLNTPLDQLTCKYCDKKCDDTESLRTHLGTHTGRRRFVCNFCNKTFSCRTTRLQHLSIHTGERHFKCPHCPKMFSGRSNLSCHIRAHLKIKNYSCDYCDKRFVQSSEKRVHELTHTGERPHQCEECGQRFFTSNKLTMHMRRHKNIRNYKCEICNKAFYGMSALKNHMPTHTGEKPFSCNICGQMFPRKKSLNTHKQLHTGEKKYVCNKCGKAFAQFAGLYSHMKSHGEKSK